MHDSNSGSRWRPEDSSSLVAQRSIQECVWPVGAFSGQGGPGRFASLVTESLDDASKKILWRYTRLTNYRKDNAELANGYMVFNKVGTPLERQPNYVTLSQVEAELGNNVSLYAHAIPDAPPRSSLHQARRR